MEKQLGVEGGVRTSCHEATDGSGSRATHGEFTLETDELRDTAPRVCFTKLHMQKTEQNKSEKTREGSKGHRTRLSHVRSGRRPQCASGQEAGVASVRVDTS